MLERADIIEIGKRTLEDLIEHPPEDPKQYLIRSTSGTSGEPIIIATGFPSEAPAQIGGSTAEERRERMVVCIGSLAGRLVNALIARAGDEQSVMRVLFLDRADIEFGVTDLMMDWRPDCLHGFCSVIMLLSEEFPEDAASAVQVLKFNGEPVLDQQSSLLRSRFPNAKQLDVYIASEAGGRIGVQCGFLPLRTFHPADGVTVEIEGPDADGIGDLLVSKAVYRGVRIERYRIGDLARFVQKPCACGAAITFELLGRSGIDYVKVAGAIARREEFDRVVSRFSNLIDEYRVEIREKGKQGEITLIAYRKGLPLTDALSTQLAADFSRELFLTPTRTLESLVESGEFRPLKITFTAKPFPPEHKNVKLKRVP